MGTRLHRIGTIFTRINGLIQKGQITERNKPIWFDVYKHFPPRYEPYYKREAPDVKVKDIFYPEDALRAKIHKALDGRLGVVDLSSNRDSRSQIMLRVCQKYISEGMSESEAIEKLKHLNESNVPNVENPEKVEEVGKIEP